MSHSVVNIIIRPPAITQEQIDKRELRPSFVPEAASLEDVSEGLTHLDAIELLEDEDDIPAYTGDFDFSSF